MGRLRCISTARTLSGWSSRAVPPVGCTRSLLIGPATLFAPGPRSTWFCPEKTFPEKKICMGKQKNRLTATKTLSDPARTTQVCPSTAHVVAAAAAANCLVAAPCRVLVFLLSRVLDNCLPGYLGIPFQGACGFGPPYLQRYSAYRIGPYSAVTAAASSISLLCRPARRRLLHCCPTAGFLNFRGGFLGRCRRYCYRA